jgi:hypothetical protein
MVLQLGHFGQYSRNFWKVKNVLLEKDRED